jgi:acetyl esterase/lipase
VLDFGMRARFLTMVLILSWVRAGFGQGAEDFPLWPAGKMPGMATNQPESQTMGKDNVLRVTNVGSPSVAVFKAPDTHGPAPAMIVCPGGAYNMLAYNLEGTEIAAWLNSLGVTGIVLKYRVPENRDGAFADVQRAVRLARWHAADWNIQPDKVGVMGFSAGGHLAARLSTNFDQPDPVHDGAAASSCRPDCVILVYPGYLETNGKLSPELTITPQTPPTLLFHAEDDAKYVPSSKVYDAALTAAGIPHQLVLYPTGGHGFGLRSKKAAEVWPGQAAQWLGGIGFITPAGSPPTSAPRSR